MNMVIFLVRQTLLFAIPLMLVALGGLFSERSGVINIALEGIMIFGAFTGTMFIRAMQTNGVDMHPQILLLLALLVSALTGVLVSLLHAFASINMKANQTISGTAINMLAPAFAIFVARLVSPDRTMHVKFSNTFTLSKTPLLGDIPLIGPMFFTKGYATTLYCVIILVLSWVVLYKTSFGLRLRACGEHPQAADSVGINVYKMRYWGVLISGALAGIGGLVFILPVSTEFNADVAGYGFLALAVLIFGQWKPWGIAGAAFFFGFMKTVAVSYSEIGFLKGLNLSSDIYKMLPYIATLIVLAITGRKSQAPRAAGIPYDAGGR